MELDDRQTAALIATLDQQDKPTIRAAVDALIALAADSPRLRDLLNHRLAETGHRHYWPVAYILGNLPKPSNAVIAGMVDALDHRDPDIRWAIALLLVRMAKENTELVNLLIQLCSTGSGNQRRMALYAIRDLALSDSESLDALLTAVADPEPTVRVAAVICLKLRQDIDDGAKNLLLGVYLNDVELKVRHAVAITLASLGAPQANFVSALRKNSESENDQIKKAAIAALELLKKTGSAPSGSASNR